MAFLGAIAADLIKWVITEGYVALGKALRKWKKRKALDDQVDEPLEDYKAILKEIKKLKKAGKTIPDALKARKLAAAKQLIRS